MINFNKIKKKLICAEIGLSHHGSIKKTKKIIDKLSLTGADIVKFQTHIAEHESTYNEKFVQIVSLGGSQGKPTRFPVF